MSKNESKRALVDGVAVLEIVTVTTRTREQVEAERAKAQQDVNRWTSLLASANVELDAANADLAKLDG